LGEKAGRNLRIRVANAELDIDEMRILHNPRVVEVHLVQQVRAIVTNVLDTTRIPRIERGEADFSDGVGVVGPVLRVEADHDYVIGSRRYARQLTQAETVVEDFLSSLVRSSEVSCLFTEGGGGNEEPPLTGLGSRETSESDMVEIDLLVAICVSGEVSGLVLFISHTVLNGVATG
jgi:hypothetical protein